MIPDPTLPVPRDQPEDWITVEEWQRRHEANVALANSVDAKVVIYGASVIEAWQQDPSLETISDKQVLALGVGGDNTQHLLWRLQNGECGRLKPEVVLVNIGNNNMGHYDASAEDTLRGVLAVDRELAGRFPGVRRVQLAMMPNQQKPEENLRRRALQYNAMLREKAVESAYEVLDIGPALLDERGWVPIEWAADFLHPTPEGYRRLAQALRRELRN